MTINKPYVVLLSLIVALGGFLLGFDSSVIAGAVPYYSSVFNLDQDSFWFGFSVGSLTVGSILGNFAGGILADKAGRKVVLIGTAVLFAFCALGTALSNNLTFFIAARIVGGIGVGMAILVAPMYIAEVAPKEYRGMLVSINQLNIVLGISVAFFTNYYINRTIADPNMNWRWMLGVGVIPAVLYFLLLMFVPQSPRWLVVRSRAKDARKVLRKIGGEVYADFTIGEIQDNIEKDKNRPKAYFRELLNPRFRLILVIGLGIACIQQLSAINAILYYAPIIFEAAGGGRDAAFMQSVILGVVNVVFTVAAMFLIDRIGRKPLLVIGLSGIILAYILSSFAFFKADYTITPGSLNKIETEMSAKGLDKQDIFSVKSSLSPMLDKKYKREVEFFNEVRINTGAIYAETKNIILKNSIHMNSYLVLAGILLFIASFAISLGPVTWALLSEIFPVRIRGLAISVAGTFNALVSAVIITIFPIELAKFGSGLTFAVFAVLCALALLFVWRYIPETKGISLEEIEKRLIKN
ncbi:MAG: sugar porter family MFS transporter [Bacteroidales bacterium]|nr:sugar porter family MFS transporter [Bacteroidales bacterium]MBN2762841.1 sugar porter family MFS transporter [Bacteroidales bacterium]